MKNLITCLSMCFLLFSCGQKQENEVLNAGFSEVSITPEKPVVMSGYGGRDDPYKGIHDSIFAQAMYLSQGEEEVLLITSDLIGHSHANVKMLKERIQKKTGIPQEKIFVTAAHNHGGPKNATYSSLDKLPEDSKEYIDGLYTKLVDISLEAKSKIQAVKIGYTKGECHLNINRRAAFSEGEIWLGRNSEGPCDHDLDILKFTDTEGKLLAVHMNWPCHGTCTGHMNYQLTGDWPGMSASLVKDKLGKDVIVMVTAGASADINPIYGPNDKFKEVYAVAYGVSSVALDLIENCNMNEYGKLVSASKSIVFPGKKGWDSRYTQASVPSDDVIINFSAFRMGKIVMAGISGELFTEIGMHVKEKSAYNTMIMTHCNGASGYICTDVAFDEGGYEPMVSPIMPGTEQKIEETMLTLINSLENTQSRQPEYIPANKIVSIVLKPK